MSDENVPILGSGGLKPPGGSIPTSGVDLADPVQLAIGKFKQIMGEAHGTAFIAIGLTPDGQVLVVRHTPGGQIQQFGLLQFAMFMASQQQQAPPELEEVPEPEPEG